MIDQIADVTARLHVMRASSGGGWGLVSCVANVEKWSDPDPGQIERHSVGVLLFTGKWSLLAYRRWPSFNTRSRRGTSVSPAGLSWPALSLPEWPRGVSERPSAARSTPRRQRQGGSERTVRSSNLDRCHTHTFPRAPTRFRRLSTSSSS